MARFLHTMSLFGFGAASGVGLRVVHPWPAAVAFAVVALLVCLALQTGRDDEVELEGDRRACDRFIRSGR